jgi:hypothetical protein
MNQGGQILGGVKIPSQYKYPQGGFCRIETPPFRERTGKNEGMGIYQGIGKIIGTKPGVQFWFPPHFREPEPLGILAEITPVRGNGNFKLGLNRLGTGGKKGQEGVGRGGAQKFNTAFPLVILKDLKDVFLIPPGKKHPLVQDLIVEMLNQFPPARIGGTLLQFPNAEFELLIRIVQIPVDKLLVGKHVTEGRGKANGHAKGDMIPVQPVKNLKKGDVRLGQGFKETPFFK